MNIMIKIEQSCLSILDNITTFAYITVYYTNMRIYLTTLVSKIAYLLSSRYKYYIVADVQDNSITLSTQMVRSVMIAARLARLSIDRMYLAKTRTGYAILVDHPDLRDSTYDHTISPLSKDTKTGLIGFNAKSPDVVSLLHSRGELASTTSIIRCKPIVSSRCVMYLLE